MEKHLLIFVNSPSKFNSEDLKSTTLRSYLASMEHTVSITTKIAASKHVYYDSYIENDSVFNDEFYQKKIHKSHSAKQQLSDALKESFGQWAKKVVFLGNHSVDVDQKDIEVVFEKLNHNEFVILPNKKGGVLIFGTCFFNSELLNFFPWNNENDLLDTILSLQKSKRTYCVLDVKNPRD